MITLFENEDFILKSTEHWYDFVGIIETKCEKPLTFFFGEDYIPHNEEDEQEWDTWDWEDNIDENKTELLGVHQGLKEYDSETDDPEDDEEQNTAEMYWMANKGIDHVDYFRTRDDKSTGFLSDPKERGWFLAIIKAYCPEQLEKISWA